MSSGAAKKHLVLTEKHLGVLKAAATALWRVAYGDGQLDGYSCEHRKMLNGKEIIEGLRAIIDEAEPVNHNWKKL